MPLLNELIQKAVQNKPAPFEPTLSKEEYVELKKDEKARAWEAINSEAEAVLSSGVELYRYLQAQARMLRISANNILFLKKQRSDVSMIKTLSQWNEIGRSVRAGEKQLLVMVAEPYKREDGKENLNFPLKGFFDISQTSGRPVASQRSLAFDQSNMLAAMINTAQVNGFEVIADNEIPIEIGGAYQDGAIHVRDDIELDKTIFGLALGSIAAERDRKGYRKSSSVEICSAFAFCEAAGIPIRYDESIEVLLESVVMDAQSMEDIKSKRNLLEYSQKSAKSLYEEVDRAAYQLCSAERQQEAPSQEQAVVENTQPAEKEKRSIKHDEPER